MSSLASLAQEGTRDERLRGCGLSGTSTCPIGGTECPGSPCVYADIMASVGFGIVVFELQMQEVLFCNQWARDALSPLGPLDFPFLARLLLSDPTPPPSSDQPPPLRIGSRLVGYTVYFSGRFAWVLLRDITDKLRLESIAEAVETMNNIGYIFSAVRHEIGNPVNSIKVALNVLESNLQRFSQQALLEYLHRMSSEIGRIEHLLRSLRNFSLFERADLREVDASSFMNDLFLLVSPELDRRGITFLPGHADGLSICCDPRALQQVLLNLITNASDALAGRERPFIAVQLEKSNSLILLRVHDNGCGIPDDEQRQIFKPFFTTKAAGTGLGLVIARKLLATMNGTIQVESVPGVGSTFSISLPAGASHAAGGAH